MHPAFSSQYRLLLSICRSPTLCLSFKSAANGRVRHFGEKGSNSPEGEGSKSVNGIDFSDETSRKSDFDYCRTEKTWGSSNSRLGEAENLAEGEAEGDRAQRNEDYAAEYIEKLGLDESLPKEEFDIGEALGGIPLMEEEFRNEESSEDVDEPFFVRRSREADKIFEVLQQDGLGFEAKSVLDEMQIRISGRLVREVLIRISKSINDENKSRCAKLAYKFFVWCGLRDDFRHTSSSYNLIMKIFADCNELRAMWKLIDEMTENGVVTTARTFNILICACGEAGLTRKLVERFIKLKTFNYRPFKHSFNAILYSLLAVRQYKLIEWVYQQMLQEGYQPDVLTYNVMISAKYRLGKLDEFHSLLDEMGRNRFPPDLHTYNILLHVLGKSDKPLAALNLLNYMEDVGCKPRVLHFTNLIDGLGRAGNVDACRYFFEEMAKKGCQPDVVCYTVMIMSLIVAGELDDARQLFDEMFVRGHLPNVFTYNSMIGGLCMAGMSEKAHEMLKEMEARGCNPNFEVYKTMVWKLQKAGKDAEAKQIITEMMEKGKYAHLVSKFKRYRRS